MNRERREVVGRKRKEGRQRRESEWRGRGGKKGAERTREREEAQRREGMTVRGGTEEKGGGREGEREKAERLQSRYRGREKQEAGLLAAVGSAHRGGRGGRENLLAGGLAVKAGCGNWRRPWAFPCSGCWGPLSLAWGTPDRARWGCRNRPASGKHVETPCASATAEGSGKGRSRGPGWPAPAL